MEQNGSDDEMLAQAIALSLKSDQVSPPPTGRSSTGTTTTLTTNLPREPAQMVDAKSSKDARWAFSSTDAPPSPGPTTKEEKREEGQASEDSSADWQSRARAKATTVLPTVKLPDMGQWVPNKECLELVMGMGISENAARRALYFTGNDNPELAVSWVFENIENPELHTSFEPPLMGPGKEQALQMGQVCQSFDDLVGEMEDVEPKMVFVVNSELKMGLGKIAAQVGHATLGLYLHLQKSKEEGVVGDVKRWEEGGSKKIVLRGVSVQHLLELKKLAYELHIPNVMVHDAGRTQVEPGSLTVLALFGKTSLVDQVTGQLRLL